MSIPPLHVLLSNSYPPKRPTPTERFAPFLLVGEELLWVGQPNAECHSRQYARGVTIAFGGDAIFCMLPFAAEYFAHITSGMSILLLCLSPVMLLFLVIERTRRRSTLEQCFAVSSHRILIYDPLGDGPDVSGTLLHAIRRTSVKADKNGCGTICFHSFLPLLQSGASFCCVEAAETVAALIMETKLKTETGTGSAGS